MPRAEVAHQASCLAPRLGILGPVLLGVGLRQLQEGEQNFQWVTLNWEWLGEKWI